MVKFEEGSRTSVTGETLYTVTFTPDTVPIGTILFHHGLGEHVGRHRRGARIWERG